MVLQTALGALAAALALAGVVSAQPAPASVQASSLRQLVDRYIAWRGGEAFVRMKGLHTAGAVDAAGLTGAFEDWQSDDDGRNQLDIGGVKMVEVITPRGSWTTNASGQVVDEPDAYEYAARDPLGGETLLGIGKAKDKAALTLRGEETADGHAWNVLQVAYGDADTYDAFIDPESGALGAARITEKGQTRFEHYSDWRMVGAVRIAFTTRIETGELGVQTLHVKSAEVNPAIDRSLFERPLGASRISFAGGAASTGWIDFAPSSEDRVYLPVTVQGQAMTAILDTGATASAVDAGLLTLLQRSARGSFPVPGENGVGEAGVASDIDLGVGGLTLHGLNVAALDIASMKARSGEPWTAILGDEVFNEAVVDLDFPHHRLAFHTPADYQPPRGALKVALARDGDDRLVPLSLDGGPPALFVMDTGFTGALRIAPALAGRQKLLEGKTSQGVTIGAIGGEAAAQVAYVNRVTLGGVSFAAVPALFSDTWPSASYTDRVGGLLGLGLLSRFRVIVDWPHDQLFLIPADADAEAGD
jgi:predicted aspartyl protease